MRSLLDTHIWLWALQDPQKLSQKTRKQLADTKNDLHLSHVSIWEANHLVRKGRLKVKPDFTKWLERMLELVPLQEAPFNFAVASRAAQIQLPQPDVCDVFLAATALAFDLTLVTADEQLLGCKWLRTLDG